jgi:hypothetical protein
MVSLMYLLLGICIFSYFVIIAVASFKCASFFNEGLNNALQAQLTKSFAKPLEDDLE